MKCCPEQKCEYLQKSPNTAQSIQQSPEPKEKKLNILNLEHSFFIALFHSPPQAHLALRAVEHVSLQVITPCCAPAMWALHHRGVLYLGRAPYAELRRRRRGHLHDLAHGENLCLF